MFLIMEKKEIYVPLALEILEVQMEKGYAVSGGDFGDGGGW